MIRFNFLILLLLLFIGCTSSEPISDDRREESKSIESESISGALVKSLAEASALRTRIYGK